MDKTGVVVKVDNNRLAILSHVMNLGTRLPCETKLKTRSTAGQRDGSISHESYRQYNEYLLRDLRSHLPGSLLLETVVSEASEHDATVILSGLVDNKFRCQVTVFSPLKFCC